MFISTYLPLLIQNFEQDCKKMIIESSKRKQKKEKSENIFKKYSPKSAA